MGLRNLAREIYHPLRTWTVPHLLRRRPIRTGMLHTLPGKLVLSLTSYPPRFRTLDLTLRCLLLQDMRPDLLVLWIAHDDLAKLPGSVKNLEPHGLVIRTCNDTGPYKKIIPALAAYPDAFILTADDDKCYARQWLRRFVDEYRDPDEILCQSATRMALTIDGKAAPVCEWPDLDKTGRGSGVLPIGSSGVLYPPNSLSPETSNAERFMALCPQGDDMWLYWMAARQGSRHRLIKRCKMWEWRGTQEVGLWLANMRGGNDRQVAAMIQAYGLPVRRVAATPVLERVE